MDIPNEVYPVVRRALEFYQRVQSEAGLSLAAVQADLRGRIKAGPSSRVSSDPSQWADMAGIYHGAPGPLVYWIDEVFSFYTPWAGDWENKKLEQSYFNTSDRAENFWNQARLALNRADKDALEVFYLALLLGFRGACRQAPADLQEWRDQFESHLGIHDALAWNDAPPALPMPPTDVPELVAKPRLKTLLISWALVGTGIIGVVTFLISKWGVS